MGVPQFPQIAAHDLADVPDVAGYWIAAMVDATVYVDTAARTAAVDESRTARVGHRTAIVADCSICAVARSVRYSGHCGSRITSTSTRR